MKIISKRLEMLANAVRPGVCVCDIGTDHAYLPIYLINMGIAPSVFACDINELPINRAKANIEMAGLTKHITLCLGDGLNAVPCLNDIDDIIIAGMGGIEIVSILSKSQVIRHNKYKLILQPMSSAELLRKWLIDNSFKIAKETACLTNNKTYTIIEATYTGVTQIVEESYYYVGELQHDGSDDCKQYLIRTAKHMRNIISGIKHTNGIYEDQLKFIKILEYIEKLIKGGKNNA